MATSCGDGATSFETETSESGTSETEDYEAGIFDGTTYINTSVGIKVTMPEGFSTFKLAPVVGTTYEAVVLSSNNSSIMIGAEDMRETIGSAVSEEEYLENMKGPIVEDYGDMGYSTDTSDLGIVKIGKTDFYGLSIEVGEGELIQQCYITRIGDIMFCILITDVDDTLSQFISTIEATE